MTLEMVKEGLAEVNHGKPAKGLDTGKYFSAEEPAREIA
jgi:hypothetical protein